MGTKGKLHLYGVGKQARWGDNYTDEPAWYDMVGNLKWSAWNEQGGRTRIECQKEFMVIVQGLGLLDDIPDTWCVETGLCLPDGSENPEYGALRE